MIKELYNRYKDFIPYIFFGAVTTIVNVAAYWIFSHLLHLKVMPSTILAWFFAVYTAYITNRKWVFYSEENSKKGILREMISFFACRLTTGFIDWACMYIFVDLIHFNDVVIKILSNIIVIILNYAASRLLIFKKRKNK